jgi:hypothetical protein
MDGQNIDFALGKYHLFSVLSLQAMSSSKFTTLLTPSSLSSILKSFFTVISELFHDCGALLLLMYVYAISFD